MRLPIDTRSGRALTRDTASALPEQAPRSREGLLDMAQAAKYLGTSERHVQRLWQERRITAIKIGRRVRFVRSDLDAFIQANRRQAVR